MSCVPFGHNVEEDFTLTEIFRRSVNFQHSGVSVGLLFDKPNVDSKGMWEKFVNYHIANPMLPRAARFGLPSEVDFQFKQIFCELDKASVCSVVWIDVAALQYSTVRGLEGRMAALEFLSLAIEAMGPSHVWWTPAGIVTPFDYFYSNLFAYLREREAFPILACLNFSQRSDQFICSNGLRFLCGQELEARLSEFPTQDAMRLVARIASDMIENGPHTCDGELDHIDPDEKIGIRIQVKKQTAIFTTTVAPAGFSNGRRLNS